MPCASQQAWPSGTPTRRSAASSRWSAAKLICRRVDEADDEQPAPRVLSPSEQELIVILKTSSGPVRAGQLAVFMGVGVRRIRTLIASLKRSGLVAQNPGGGIVAADECGRSRTVA